eukprot:1192609-Prorocentrum_minimum.AAC.2
MATLSADGLKSHFTCAAVTEVGVGAEAGTSVGATEGAAAGALGACETYHRTGSDLRKRERREVEIV